MQCVVNAVFLQSFIHCTLFVFVVIVVVARSFKAANERQSGEEEEDEEIPEYLRLHQLIVEEIGKICRKVNQVNAFRLFCKLRFHLQ